MANSDITAEINKIFSDYTEKLKSEISDALDEVGEELLQDVKNNSPVDTGTYKKGWKKKETTTSSGDSKSIVVYNSTRPQLTTFLEKGHRMVNKHGKVVGYVKAKPHIKPAEERAVEKFEKRVEEILEDAN